MRRGAAENEVGDEMSASATASVNSSISPVSGVDDDDLVEEKPRADKVGERLADERIDREKLLLPSLISVSAETAEAPSMDFARSYLFGGIRETIKVERAARVSQGFAAPPLAPLPVLPSRPGFIRLGTEATSTFPDLNDLWGQQPIGAPYPYQCFPYNNVCVSSQAAPNLKRKVEVFGNSQNTPQVESLFGCMPGSFYHDSVLHAGFVPVQAVLQNPFFPTPFRAPLNYSVSSPIVRNQEMGVPATSRGPLINESLIGSASVPMHKRKVIRPNFSSSTSMTLVSDGNNNTSLETSASGRDLYLGELNALEETPNGRPSSVSAGLETQSGFRPSASLYQSVEDKEIEGKGWIVLVQKELRNTDVGNLGRIVLPKKDAEANLPQLVAKDGLILQMEDMMLSIEWKFKYRYWPNNRSRMYVMENTGDFVRTHNLQTGDFFIVYKEESSGKYIARGKKGMRPLNTGDIVGLRDNGRVDEGESRTKGLFSTEQRTSEGSDLWINSKAVHSPSASGVSFVFQGDHDRASNFFP